jgi:hypothetical protein
MQPVNYMEIDLSIYLRASSCGGGGVRNAEDAGAGCGTVQPALTAAASASAPIIERPAADDVCGNPQRA